MKHQKLADCLQAQCWEQDRWPLVPISVVFPYPRSTLASWPRSDSWPKALRPLSPGRQGAEGSACFAVADSVSFSWGLL